MAPPRPARGRGRVAIETLGCKLNQAESDAIARQFQAAGFALVDARSPADVYVLNSCTVTQAADRKARQSLRRARRVSPAALTVLTGCYPSVAPEDAAARSGADLVIGNRDKAGLVAAIAEYQARLAPTLAETPADLAPPDFPPAHLTLAELSPPAEPIARRTRAFVKIQDGCNDFCAFCIVPTARGRSTSRPPEEIVAEVADRVAKGIHEVVLTGVQIGWYGRDGGLRRRDGWDLAHLIRSILDRTAIDRVRLTSIHPRDITPDLIDAIADPRVCPHLHLSLQSGSERILVLMRRRSTAAEYRSKVAAVRERIPDLAFTTDLIVGFPGETEADFADTCRLSREVGFAQIHVFRFSPRAGTHAATLPDPVPEPVKSDRAERLAALAADLAADFQRQSIGRIRPVLFESRTPAGPWTGLTDTYLRVEVAADRDLANTIYPVRLVDLADGRLIGRIDGG